MRYAAPAFLMLLAATAPALPNGARVEQRQRAQAEAADEILTYTTKPGDTLKELARRWFVRPEDWRLAQALNRLPNPDAIPAGTVLRLRSTWIRTTPISAELVAFRGDVRILSGEGAARPGEKGMALGEGDLIETGANGFATLALPDGSRVSLPSASRVRLTRLRQVPMSDSIDRRFTLEQGRTEARVTPMANPASRFLITTPVAVAAVRGTQYSVSFTPSEMRQLTQVTEGKVGVRSLKGGAEVLVLAGFGVVADAEGVGQPTRLLPGPQMKAPRRIQNGETVTFEFDAVPNARGYRVEIATDRGFSDRVAAMDTTETSVSFTDIPNGQLFVRVFAIDGNGLLGQPVEWDFTRQYAGGTAGAAPARRDGAGEAPEQAGAGGEEGSRDDGGAIDWAGVAADTTRFLFAAPPPGGALGGGLPGFGEPGDLLAELVASLGGGAAVLPGGPAAGLGAGAAGAGAGGGGGGAGGGGAGGGGGLGGGGFAGAGGGGAGGGGGLGGGGFGGGGGGGAGAGGTPGGGGIPGGGGAGGTPGGGIPGGGIPGGGTPGGEAPGGGAGPGGGTPGGGGGGTPGGGTPGGGTPGGGGAGGGGAGGGGGPVVIPGDPGFPGQPELPGVPGQPENPVLPGGGFPGDGGPGGGLPGGGLPGGGNPGGGSPGGDMPGWGLPGGGLPGGGLPGGGLPGGGLPGGGAAVVPEPATWLFLLSGFGLVGFALRRRQRGARA